MMKRFVLPLSIVIVALGTLGMCSAVLAKNGETNVLTTDIIEPSQEVVPSNLEFPRITIQSIIAKEHAKVKAAISEASTRSAAVEEQNIKEQEFPCVFTLVNSHVVYATATSRQTLRGNNSVKSKKCWHSNCGAES